MQPTVNVKASVINPGPYAFVVHYFQPYEVSFTVDVEVNVDGVPNRGKALVCTVHALAHPHFHKKFSLKKMIYS